MEPIEANISTNRPIFKDDRERDTENKFFELLANSDIAMIAPILTLSRMPDLDAKIGTSTHFAIRDVTNINGQVIRVDISIETKQVSGVINQDNILYRTVDSTVGPFLCITKGTSDQQVVTAFASSNEFIVNNMDGDESAVIQQLKAAAEEKGMYSLLEFINN